MKLPSSGWVGKLLSAMGVELKYTYKPSPLYDGVVVYTPDYDTSQLVGYIKKLRAPSVGPVPGPGGGPVGIPVPVP